MVVLQGSCAERLAVGSGAQVYVRVDGAFAALA